MRDLNAALEAALRQLSASEEQVVKLRFGLDGRHHGMEDIVRELDLTRSQALAIEARALRKLRLSGSISARDTRRKGSRPQQRSMLVDSASRRPEARSRRGEMEDRELVRIAAFKLQESAKRMATLAHEAGAPAVRGRLSSLSRELLEHARTLELLAPPRSDRRSRDLEVPLARPQTLEKTTADYAD